MKLDEGSKASTHDGDNPRDIVRWSMCAGTAISMTKQDLPRYHFGQLAVLLVAICACGLLLLWRWLT